MRIVYVAVVIAVALMSASAIGLTTVIQTQGLRIQKKEIYPANGETIHNLPREYPSWKAIGPDKPTTAEEIKEMGTDNFVSRYFEQKEAYEDKKQPHLFELHIAYYTGMIDAVPHVPERCLVGAGVQQRGLSRVVDVPLDMAKLIIEQDLDPELHPEPIYKARSPIRFDRVRLPVGVDRLKLRVTPFRGADGRDFYAGYFFITNGGTVPSADAIRLLAFRLEDEYAYYTKVQFTSWTVESPEELGELAGAVLDEVFPELMRYLPDWVEVKEGRYP
jgi:hypothetical protein